MCVRGRARMYAPVVWEVGGGWCDVGVHQRFHQVRMKPRMGERDCLKEGENLPMLSPYGQV